MVNCNLANGLRLIPNLPLPLISTILGPNLAFSTQASAGDRISTAVHEWSIDDTTHKLSIKTSLSLVHVLQLPLLALAPF